MSRRLGSSTNSFVYFLDDTHSVGSYRARGFVRVPSATFLANAAKKADSRTWKIGHVQYFDSAEEIMPALYAEYPCYTAADGSDGWWWMNCPDPWDGGLGDCTGGLL
jgi:hypothetical protein